MRKLAVRLTADNQIEVTVGTESRTGETYYLGMNINTLDAPEVDEELSERPIEGCIALVREWLRLLLELRDGQQVFLPFDFSDEYTRWLTIRREGREATAVLGWSTVEGWAISPSNFEEHAHSLPEFSPDEPLHVQTFYMPQLLSNLRQSLMELQASASS